MAIDEPSTPEGESSVTEDADTSRTPRTSVRQIKANRRNARHSTGPATPEGKQASRFNALRHGLRAKEIIIPGQEDPAEFDAILRELCEDWEPEGHTEFHLVGQIGLAEWRLRRVHRAELGEIRTQMASRMASQASEVEDEIEQEQANPLSARLPQVLGKSTAGIAHQRQAVEDARDELESEGEVSEITIGQLERVFGAELDSPTTMLKEWFVEEMPEGDEEDLDSDSEPRRRRTSAKKKAAAREHLEMTLKNLDRQERNLHRQERINLEIAWQRLSIPQASETIQRYETTIKRDMYRAIDQLERLRRRRRGEPSPPTVNVNVSCDNDD
jgi:hypothetical protein